MLYQPTNIYPSMTGGLGNGVIDASKDLTVSWQVNGNSALQSFQITIYENNSTSTQVYTTGNTGNGCPFYGVDYAGNTQFFSYTISADDLSSAGIMNGYQYKLLIKQWWGSSDAYSVTQSAASAFITRATPTLQIGTIPEPLATRSYTFTAEYAQQNGDGLNWIRWMIASKRDGTYETLKDSGSIYGTSVFQFSYDGLFSGNSYAIRCEAQTENGVTVDTGWNDFDVLYTAEEISGTLKVCGSRKGNGVRISIPGTVNIPAKVTGDGMYTISDSIMTVEDGTTATWDSVDGTEMDIPEFNPMVRISEPYLSGAFEIAGLAPDIGGFELVDTSFVPQITAYVSDRFVVFAKDGVYYHDSESGNVSKEQLKTGWKKTSFQKPASSSWTGYCNGNSKTLAITDGTTGAVSADGTTWKKITLPGSGYQCACYWWSKSLYIIGGLGSDGNAKFAYSSDAENWTVGTFTNTSGKKTGAAVSAIGSDYILCVTDNGFTIKTTDGITWSVVSVSGLKFSSIYATTYSFIATTNDLNSNSVFISSDGVQWKAEDIGVHLNYLSNAACWGFPYGLCTGIADGKIVRMRDEYINSELFFNTQTTDLGISSSGIGKDIAYVLGKSAYIACYRVDGSDEYSLIVGDQNALSQIAVSSYFSHSSYGSLASNTIPVSASWTKLIYGNGMYAAISSTSGNVIYSADGKTWSYSSTGLSGCLDITACNGYFAVIGADQYIYVTESFGTWEKRGKPNATGNAGLAAIAYGSGTLVSTGMYGYFFSTDDGYTWNVAKSSITAFNKSVCYGNDRFVAVSEYGNCAYSFDGKTWSGSNILGESFTRVRYVGKKFVAIANEKKYVYYSDDGILWYKSAQTNDGNLFYDVTYAYGTFLLTTDVQTDAPFPIYETNNFQYFEENSYYTGDVKPTLQNIVFHNGKAVVALPASGNSSYTKGSASILHHTQISGFWVGRNTPLDYGSAISISTKNNTTKITTMGYDDASSAEFFDEFPQFSSISSVKFTGNISCDYVMLAKGELPDETLQKFHEDLSYHPRDVEHYFYADFDSNMNAGEFGSTGFTNMAIYRQSPGDSALTRIVDISPDDGTSIVDVSAVMGKTYTYYAYGIGLQNSSVLTSNDISLCFWDWALLACTTDNNGVYHPQQIFLFSNNVSIGDVSNNNSPNILQNFTRYPIIQQSPWNYRSGTLTSLIGSVSGGKYCDSVDLRNAITELSTSSRELFLKSRKGDLIKIALSGAIEMETMDNSPQQAQTMKLPWVEIGDASSVSIVLTQNDGAWVQSLDSPVVMGCCGAGSGAAASYAYPLTILQQGKTTVYDGSEAKKVVIKDGGGSGGIVAEDDGNGNITIY